MKKNIFILFILSLLLSPNVLYAQSLELGYMGGNSSNGNMFDIIAKKDMTITGFDIHTVTIGSDTVEIYGKEDTHVGYENNDSAWNLLATVPISKN